MSDFSTYLYARPSFVEGMARLFDFGDTLTEYNCALTGAQADFLALHADWMQVGADLREAIHRYEAAAKTMDHVGKEHILGQEG